jgi:hypothetical protein
MGWWTHTATNLHRKSAHGPIVASSGTGEMQQWSQFVPTIILKFELDDRPASNKVRQTAQI